MEIGKKVIADQISILCDIIAYLNILSYILTNFKFPKVNIDCFSNFLLGFFFALKIE